MLPISFLILTGLLFFSGTAVGSFLNVFIYRTINGKNWAKGRSKCESCSKKISWYDNIPLLSYLFLKGKCRHCRQSIDLIHPVVEFLAGSLFVWWYWGGSLFFRLTTHPLTTLQPLFWLVVGILLLVIVVADLRYLVIPDLAVGLLFSLTFLYRLFLSLAGIMQWQDFGLAMASMVVLVAFFFFLWWITRRKGFGFGDVKFAAPMALLLGWPKILVGVFFAFILGALIGIILILVGKKKIGQVIPFGPFLVLGTILALIWGENCWQWYLSLM